MSDIVQCPYCSEDIKAAAKKCKHCGEMLDVGTHSVPAEGATNPPVASEVEYYSDANVRVTSSLIKIGSQTYQASNISSVLIKQRPKTLRGCLGTAGWIFLGYVAYMIFFVAAAAGDEDSPMIYFGMLGPILFIVALVYAGLRSLPYELRLTTSGLEKCALVSPHREALEPIAEAIEKAFRRN